MVLLIDERDHYEVFKETNYFIIGTEREVNLYIFAIYSKLESYYGYCALPDGYNVSPTNISESSPKLAHLYPHKHYYIHTYLKINTGSALHILYGSLFYSYSVKRVLL